jgi:hypothetical protein
MADVAVLCSPGKFAEPIGRGPIIDRIHLVHIDGAEGLRIPDAEP